MLLTSSKVTVDGELVLYHYCGPFLRRAWVVDAYCGLHLLLDIQIKLSKVGELSSYRHIVGCLCSDVDAATWPLGLWVVRCFIFTFLEQVLTPVDIDAITYFSGVTGVAYSCAIEILAAVSIGSDVRYIPTTGQT